MKTYIENITEFALKGYKVVDCTINGKCSKCGECCGSILPIDQEDLDLIEKYVIENKIFPQKQMLVMCHKLQCPYYTGKKEKGCAIYEARPKICRLFNCNKAPSIDTAKKLKNAIPVDMWSIAIDIEKEMVKDGLNKTSRKKTK